MENNEATDIKKGVFFIICSAFFFALMAVFVKLAGDIHFMQKAFSAML